MKNKTLEKIFRKQPQPATTNWTIKAWHFTAKLLEHTIRHPDELYCESRDCDKCQFFRCKQ